VQRELAEERARRSRMEAQLQVIPNRLSLLFSARRAARLVAHAHCHDVLQFERHLSDGVFF
jgi:hypothetical protein